MMIENSLNEYGFECSKVTDGFSVEYFFRRKKAEFDQIILVYGERHRIGINEVNVKMRTPQPCIAFHVVESILAKAIGVSGESFYTIFEDVSRALASAGVSGLVLNNGYFDVNTEQEETAFADLLKRVFNEHGSAFFERFDELQKADNHLSTLTEKDFRWFLSPVGGNVIVHRAAIIKHLSGNPKAEEYHRYLKTGMQKKLDVKALADMYAILLNIEREMELNID